MRRNCDPPPSYYEPPEPKTYYCPICGEETDTYFKDRDGDIVGCDNCVRPVEPWEENEDEHTD